MYFVDGDAKTYSLKYLQVTEDKAELFRGTMYNCPVSVVGMLKLVHTSFFNLRKIKKAAFSRHHLQVSGVCCGDAKTRTSLFNVRKIEKTTFFKAPCTNVGCLLSGRRHRGASVERLRDRPVPARSGDPEGGSLLHRRGTRLQRRKSQLVPGYCISVSTAIFPGGPRLAGSRMSLF